MLRFLILISLLAAVLAGCAPATGQVTNLTPAELQQRLEKGDSLVLVDVREEHEYREGHIPGARLIPLGSLADRMGELDRAAQIVVVCRSGNRSAQGAATLAKAGFTRVYNMTGGMLKWQGEVAK